MSAASTEQFYVRIKNDNVKIASTNRNNTKTSESN